MMTNSLTPKVLVVEDDRTASLVLSAMLRNDGFEVICAESGPEGRAVAWRERPALILMDVNMPVEDGFETCRKLKQDSSVADVPIIFVTSSQDVDSKIAGFEAGGVDYITKPYERAEVLARVRTHLRLRYQSDALASVYAERIAKLASVQKAIMPTPEDVPDARFSVVYRPLQEAGGDFYDVGQAAPGVFDFVVADIGGHDLGTSFATAALKALLHGELSLVYTPVEKVRMLDQVMRSVLQDEQFLTLVYVRLNRMTGELYLVSAGHPPVIVVDADGNARLHDFPGDILGAFQSPFRQGHTVRISKGDRFFIYTDGILETGGTERMSRNEQMELLTTASKTAYPRPIKEAAKTVVDTVRAAGRTIEDDVTVLVVEY